MKKFIQYSSLSLLWVLTACSSPTGHITFETVPNDPMQTRIYTLDNGLKVYMSVNKDQPRLSAYIAVRAGSKCDPEETTGLAHYFEHLMFKGTTHFGTQNFEAEKPMLDQIEQLFEVYRQTDDSLQRKAIYHTIDSISYEASKIAIPNEYDKLMAAIGATGTNAFTSYDLTCYVEDIPSNQVENWAKIQADRFKNVILRGFHTELETVYEEYNMYASEDNSKTINAMLKCLFPTHPYGRDVIGYQKDLKNPSITNIKHFYDVWYVPNNMGIFLAGDFDPDSMIEIIDRNFGDMKPSDSLPVITFAPEKEITAPIDSTIYGPESEYAIMAWRFPGANCKDTDLLELMANVLSNGKAGLLDLDLNQKQKVLGVYAGAEILADYSVLYMECCPKEGQSLDDIRNLVLAEIDILRKGEFDEKMLEGIINNYKLEQLYQVELNENRAHAMLSSFVNEIPWAEEVNELDRLSTITKDDIVTFANKYMNDSNYVIIYKRQGKDPNEIKMSKPEITPIATNRDTASAFLKEIQQSVVTPIEPVFVDFDLDMDKLEQQPGLPVLYKQNVDNERFSLVYMFDMGNYQDKALSLAAQYLDYLGTSDMTPEEIKSEFYRMACSMSVSTSDRRTYLTLSGLNENFEQAISLFERLLADAQVNQEAYTNLVNDELKSRNDAKHDLQSNFSRLNNYIAYGAENPSTYILSAKELKNMAPQELIDRIHKLTSYKHTILYYGPYSDDELLSMLRIEHKVPATLAELPVGKVFEPIITSEKKIFIAPYDAKQVQLRQLSNNGEMFNPNTESLRKLYNEYFNGGMNGIVFQEMRESRSLAYSAWAYYAEPGYKNEDYLYYANIGTQTDKMMDAVTTFNDIINNMPVSETAFQLAKEAMLSRMRSNRTTKSDILFSYINAQDLGLDEDINKRIFDEVQKYSLQDVIDYQQKNVKGRTFYYGILGNKTDIDMKALRNEGPIIELSTEDIFGY